MKKALLLGFVVMTLGIMAQPGYCNPKSAMNMDAANISKAMKVISANRAIFQDPQKLEQFVRLSQSLKKK